MNTRTLLSSLLFLPGFIYAQSAIDAYNISQSDLKGTARFMSMGGAFGALGSDLTTMSQNPAGIGVYRKSEIGFTVDLQCNSTAADAQGLSLTTNSTKFLLNNIGGVATFNLDNDVVNNLNIGFAYNRGASFHRRYYGDIGTLHNSLSNYIAGVSNNTEATVGDLTTTAKYDPYNPTDGGFVPQWISILGYDSYLINPEGDPDAPVWRGQWQNGTSGSGYFGVEENGGINEYNISLGGNFCNVVYWGMNFGIIDIDYSQSALWGEELRNAYVDGYTNDANWNLRNAYTVSGNGFNYKIGVIVKPIQALRLGFAVHTPTWYNLDETYYGRVDYSYPGSTIKNGYADTNNGYTGVGSCDFRSPWRFIASAAGVIGQKFIISADYEWTSYSTMKYMEAGSSAAGWYDDYWWDDYWYKPAVNNPMANYDPYYDTNHDIKDYYTNTSTFRVGAEYRVTPQFSLRAGFSHMDSPVKQSVRDNQATIYTAGTTPQYTFDNSTDYITCGFGYKYQKFYVDMAYVFKHRSSEYHAYTPDVSQPSVPSPQAKITDSNSQIVLSMGFRF